MTTSFLTALKNPGSVGYPIESKDFTARLAYDAQGLLLYSGLAKPGTATDSERWQICKMTYDVNSRLISITFPDGRASFSKAWDDRATLTYE